VQAEEERRPHGVENQLKSIDGQGQRGASEPELARDKPTEAAIIR
jgi:hypothetical protein